MSNTVTLLGTLTAGPQGMCDGGFPGGLLQLQFGLAGSCPGAGTKPAAKKFWSNTDVSTAALAFVDLDGVGAGESVTKGNMLYLRTTAPLVIRMTTADPLGGPDVVSAVSILGLMILEFYGLGYLKRLEASGVGGVEWFVSGNE